MKWTQKISIWFNGESHGDIVIHPEKDWSASIVMCLVGVALALWAGIVLRMYVVDTIAGKSEVVESEPVVMLKASAFEKLFTEFDARAERYNQLRAVQPYIADPIKK